MRLTILYFSGTGNTDYVAQYLGRKLGHLPLDIELRSMERQPPETLDGFDVLAVGFPVYACDSPGFLQDYLQRLPPGKGRGAFVFCTKGAYAGGAVLRNQSRLVSLGYVALGGGSVAMPGSDGLAFLPKGSWMARSALQKDYDHLRAADSLARQMAKILSELTMGEPAEAWSHPLDSRGARLLIDRLWSYIYEAAGNRLRSRFRADERCAGCGLCAQLCPVSNVELRQGRPHFADGCVLCMRCIHACPQEAIQIGKATVDRFRWRGPKGQFKPLRLRPE